VSRWVDCVGSVEDEETTRALLVPGCCEDESCLYYLQMQQTFVWSRYVSVTMHIDDHGMLSTYRRHFEADAVLETALDLL
jgi:hypothetical protein